MYLIAYFLGFPREKRRLLQYTCNISKRIVRFVHNDIKDIQLILELKINLQS